MPMRLAASSVIVSLNPVHNMMGMAGLSFQISVANSFPVMLGMVISVITRSKAVGFS